jgi:spore germination protein KC
MMKAKKALALALITMMLIGISGCGNYRETEDLVFVDAAAIDKEPNGRFMITVETSNVSGGTEAKVMSRYLETEGDTIIDAMQNAQRFAVSELYWSHMEILIISQEVARDDFAEVLDTLMRHPQIRLSMAIAVSKLATASEALEAENPSQQLNGPSIMLGLKSQRLLGKAPYTQLFEVINTVKAEGQETVLPLIGITETNGKKEIEISGAAVFNDFWMAGFLDENDCRIFLMAAMRVTHTFIPLTIDPGNKFSDATVEIFTKKVDIIPDCSGDKPKVNIYISGDIVLKSIDGASTDQSQFKQVTDAVTQDTSTAIENSVVALINRTKDLNSADILGIGETLNDSQPQLWKQLTGHWRDLYKQMEVNVYADITLRNTDQIGTPLSEKE